MTLKSSSTHSELARISYDYRKRQRQKETGIKTINTDTQKEHELLHPPKPTIHTSIEKFQGEGTHSHRHGPVQKNKSQSKCTTSLLALTLPNKYSSNKIDNSTKAIPDTDFEVGSKIPRNPDSNPIKDKDTRLQNALAYDNYFLKPQQSLAEDRFKSKVLQERCGLTRCKAAEFIKQECHLYEKDFMKFSSEPLKRAPTIKQKQNLMNVFWQLQGLLDNAKMENSDIKGKKPTPTPLHLIAESPKYIDFLLKDHEFEWEIERLRQQEEIKLKEATAGKVNVNLKPGWRRPMQLENVFDRNNRVFGVHLLKMQKYASMVIPLYGYQHDLPIIVCLCVEELKTSVKVDNLFERSLNSQRLEELVQSFDSGPRYKPLLNVNGNLVGENILDVGELLRKYINSLPHSLMNPAVYDAFRYWCVSSSLDRNPKSLEGKEKELHRIQIARLLFKSLPSMHCALLSYLCNFFHHISNNSDWNHLQTSKLADMFAVPLLTLKTDLSTKREACIMMKWILDRWDKISNGIFDLEGGPAPQLSTKYSYLSQCKLQVSSSSTSAAASVSNGDQNGPASYPVNCPSPSISFTTSDSNWTLQTPNDLIPALEINKPDIKLLLPPSLNLRTDQKPVLKPLNLKKMVQNDDNSLQPKVIRNARVQELRIKNL